MKLFKIALMTLTATISYQVHADPACEIVPKCGEYNCVTYIEGEWRHDNGEAIHGAYISADESLTNFELFLSDDGTVTGNPVKILATCMRQ